MRQHGCLGMARRAARELEVADVVAQDFGLGRGETGPALASLDDEVVVCPERLVVAAAAMVASA